MSVQSNRVLRALTCLGPASLLAALTVAVMASTSAPAQAQTASVCGPAVKEEIARALAAVDAADDEKRASVERELYARFQYCIADNAAATSSFHEAARQCGAVVSNLGNTFFEEMSCSGYDPQRRQFASPIKIKQVAGYGPAQLPGSREYVLHCVADSGGTLVPVGRDSVHLANAIGNQPPTWQFAVIAAANHNLQTVQPMNGQMRRAKSILSWALPPTDCNFTPIFGNALNYRIRLDQ